MRCRRHPGLVLAVLTSVLGCGGGGGGGGSGSAEASGSEDDGSATAPSSSASGSAEGTSDGADATSADATDAGDDTTSVGDSDTQTTEDDGGGSSSTGDPGLRCGVDLDCTGDTVWSRRFGNDDGTSSSEGITAVAAHPDGGAVIGGWIDGQASFDDAGVVNGPTSAFVARLDDEGQVLWVHPITATHGIGLVDLEVDAQGDIAVLGDVLGELQSGADVLPGNTYDWGAWLLGLDGDGEPRFADRFDADWVVPSQLAIGPNDEIGIVGWFEGITNFGGAQLGSIDGEPDPFVAVFEHDGAHRWSRRFGDDASQLGEGIAFDDAGDLAVTVHNYGVVDFGDGVEHTVETLVALALAKLDGDDGEAVWSRQIAVPGFVIGLEHARLASDGQRFWLATFAGQSTDVEVDFGTGPVSGHFFVAALGNDGDALWVRGLSDDAFGGGGCRGIATSGEGSLVVAGYVQKPTDFGDGTVHDASDPDAFVVKYDADTGDAQWVRFEGDDDQQSRHQAANAVDVAADGRVWTVGEYGGIIDWGDGDLVAGGGFGGLDGFVAVLQP